MLFDQEKATITVLPERPAPPTQPDAYTGLYYTPGSTSSSESKQFLLDHTYGGWGAFTMGLLKPVASMEHSFGIFGQVASSGAYNAQE